MKQEVDLKGKVWCMTRVIERC